MSLFLLFLRLFSPHFFLGLVPVGRFLTFDGAGFCTGLLRGLVVTGGPGSKFEDLLLVLRERI
jgi:hypothetical protein